MTYPKTMYKATFSRIEPVTVTGSSECFLMVHYQYGTRREAKQSARCSFHETWDAAKGYIILKAETEVDAAKYRLDRANECLLQIRNMQNPSWPPL